MSMHCFQYCFTSGADGNVPEYQVTCYDFEPLATSDTAESSSNSAHSEQFNDASCLRLGMSMKISNGRSILFYIFMIWL